MRDFFGFTLNVDDNVIFVDVDYSNKFEGFTKGKITKICTTMCQITYDYGPYKITKYKKWNHVIKIQN
jgi:hypothetical protein